MQTALYLRVSTDSQDTKIQRRALLSWLKDQGLSRNDVLWYKDQGAASDSKSREAFDRLMIDIRAKRVNRLVCWKLDRINRWGVKDHLRWRLELDSLGVGVVSLTEADAANFDGIIAVIRESIEAEGRSKWLKDHRDRVRAGVKAAVEKRKGKWGGALVPPGQPGGPKFTPEQVERIRSEVRAGGKPWQIAKRFGVRYVTVKKLVG